MTRVSGERRCIGLAIGLALVVTACGSVAEMDAGDAAGPDAIDVAADAGCPTPDAGNSNALSSNILTSNGGGPPSLALIANPLTAESLENLPGVRETLENDPNSRTFVSYMVGCALTAGQTIRVQLTSKELVLEGSLGLAPEWRTGNCDEACQEWVSACMLARTNAYGVRVVLSMRANHPALRNVSAEEIARFPTEEGAFFGNLFLPTPQLLACQGTGYDPLFTTFRQCAQIGDRCFRVVGTCGLYNGATGMATERRVCEGRDEQSGGTYLNCHTVQSDPDGVTFGPVGRVFTRAITVYIGRRDFGLRPSSCP